MHNMNEVDILNNIRKSIVHMTHYSKSSHVGTSLSIVDILYALYFKVLRINPSEPDDCERDKFLLSKGHGSAALYATLAERGFFDKDLLERYYIDGGVLPGHLDKEAAPGVEISAGSLGHGLSIGVGMAFANRIDHNPGQVYVLLGDGECNEGSVWEAAMLAGTHHLNNLTVIIDSNKLQGFGKTNDIINQENISSSWESFGWKANEVDGHDVDQLVGVLESRYNQPQVIIAHTVKGKGISFMEDKLEWHYKSPNNEQFVQSIKELGGE